MRRRRRLTVSFDVRLRLSIAARLLFGLLALMAMVGCASNEASDGNRLSVRSASIVSTLAGPVLELSLDCHLGETLRNALDHGIPLTLTLRLSNDDRSIQAQRRVELRYFPLSRRYVLRDRDRSDILRSAIAPAYVLDALAALRVPLDRELTSMPSGQRWHIDVHLDRNTLPGALRLPALLLSDWQLRAPEYTWIATAG